MSYILNCFVLGENPFEKIFQFPLDTSKHQTVGLLKDAIIANQKLNVASKDVKLWSVDLPITDANEGEKQYIINKCTNVNVNFEELGGMELQTLAMCNVEFT